MSDFNRERDMRPVVRAWLKGRVDHVIAEAWCVLSVTPKRATVLVPARRVAEVDARRARVAETFWRQFRPKANRKS